MRINDKFPACHYLRKNHGNSVPQTCVLVHVVPIEVPNPNSPGQKLRRLGIGHAIFWRWEKLRPLHSESIDFNTPEQFWSWLIQFHVNKRSLWLFSYRLGEALTLLDFFGLVDNGFYRLNDAGQHKRFRKESAEAITPSENYFWVTRDPPTIIQARHERHFLHCIDVRNYFNESLDTISEWTAIPRVPKPSGLADPKQWIDHARADAVICKTALTRLMGWWQARDMGVFRYTASSLSFAHFRHRHMRVPIMIDDCDPAREISREALASGECRMWFCGKVVPPLDYLTQTSHRRRGNPLRLREGPIYVADVNSLYPAMMVRNLYPRKLVAFKDRGEMLDLSEWQKSLCLVARVQIDTKDRVYPAWQAEQRWWAVGKFWTTLAGPELRQALQEDLIVSVGSIAAYLPGRPFDSFVNELYPLKMQARRDGDGLTDRFCKMLLNSLPGKLAQQISGWEWINSPGIAQRWGKIYLRDVTTGRQEELRLIAGHCQHEIDPLDAPSSLPAITAFVNAYARIYMGSVRDRLPAGSFLYQDTDSLHLTFEGWQALQGLGLVDDDRLGAFSLRLVAQSAHYRGCKDYTLDGVHYVAGRKAEAVESGSDFYVQDNAMHLDSILGKKPDGVVVVTTHKNTFGRYHPRGVLWADGSVTPAVIQGAELSLDPGPAPDHSAQAPRKSKLEDPPF